MSNNQITSIKNLSETTTAHGSTNKSAALKNSTNANVTGSMMASTIGIVDANSTLDSTVSNPPRRHFTRQRRQLTPSERQQRARDASLHLVKLQQRLPPRARIGLYYDGFGELPTQPLLDWCQRLGYLPYLPVVGSLGQHDKRLRFVPIYHGKFLNIPTRIHNLGMKQNHHRRLLWARELDVLICPLTAVDKHGNRMGMGGGFYDTTLAKSYKSGAKKPLKIGWCYDFQVIDQLQRQPWDVPLDGLITPSGLRWF